MALHLPDLNARTRRAMLDEFEADVAARRLYVSPYLTAIGRAVYEAALRAALRRGNEESLAAQLRRPGRMGTPVGWKAGGLVRKYSSTVPDTLAEVEFHRFYVRGLCRRTLAEGIQTLVIHRAEPGPPSNAGGMVGVHIDAASLLEDLRTTTGAMPPRVLRGYPGPGLSVRRPSREHHPTPEEAIHGR